MKECKLCIREALEDHDYCASCLQEQIEKADLEQRQLESYYWRTRL